MVTLGEQLKANLIAIRERENIEKASIEAAKRQKLAAARTHVKHLIENIHDGIVSAIICGNIPAVKVENYDDRDWLRSVSVGNNVKPNSDLWQELVTHLQSEGLKIKLENQRDGCGMEGWIIVTTEPL